MSAEIIELGFQEALKCCVSCGESKPLYRFYGNFDKRYGKTYYMSKCRVCVVKERDDKGILPRKNQYEEIPLDCKRCTKCGEVKSDSAFSAVPSKDSNRFTKSRSKYLKSICKKCHSRQSCEDSKNNRPKVNAAVRKRYQEKKALGIGSAHYALMKFRSVKRKCREYNIPCNLDLEDIVIPQYCPILGIKLEMHNSFAGDNSPSIDRIIPEKGYVKGNVVVVSQLVNRVKNSATIDQLKSITNYYERWGAEND